MEGLRVGKNTGWAAPCGLADVPRQAPQALERLFGAESVLHTLPWFPVGATWSPRQPGLQDHPFLVGSSVLCTGPGEPGVGT